MMRRKHRKPKSRPADWLISDEFEGHRRGEEFTFEDWNGLRRRGRFIEYVVAPTGDWITCIEIDSKGEVRGGVRSLHPHMVRRWWKKKKRGPSLKQKRKIQRGIAP